MFRPAFLTLLYLRIRIILPRIPQIHTEIIHVFVRFVLFVLFVFKKYKPVFNG